MKNIIVVADDKTKKSGRKFVHLLSKIKNIKATLYSPKIYEDNEHQLTGNNYIIFLGKNEVSNDFLSVISSWNETKGVCWGFDDKIAMIYIKNSDVNIRELDEEIKTSMDSLGAAGTLGILPPIILSPWYFMIWVWELIYKIGRMKIIQEKQYDLGMLKFIEKDLKEYIK